MNNEQLRAEWDKKFAYVGGELGIGPHEDIADYWLNKMEEALSHQRVEKISEYGFKELVEIAREMLAKVYPLDVFDGNSEDTGPRFTAKLHEALSLLDTPTNLLK